jgi:hypothetical protein
MSFYFLIVTVVILITGFIFYRVFGGIYKQMQNRKRLAREGILAVAYVQSIAQTGTTVNQMPEMRLSLQIENVGGQSRQVEIKQLIDLGSIPSAGDQVYVLIDPKDPANVVLSPTTFAGGVQTKIVDEKGNNTGTVDLNSNAVKSYMALTPELREKGKLGVATIISVIPAGGHNSQITMDIDNIGQEVKRVSITQPMDGYSLITGTRVYFLYDREQPAVMALAPSATMGGQNLGTGTNRLDALVQMANPLLAQKGYSKWELVLTVKPQDVTPAYQANLTISLSSTEKAARIAHEGAEVPLRYDPLNLQTVSIDSIAMGYPDPYEAAIKAFTDQMSNG